jgi:Lon protease-like protein
MPHPFHSFTDLPQTLPLFPLTGVVLLPRGMLPLNVFEPRYLKLVDDALRGDRLIGIIQPTENPDTVLKPNLSAVGAAGRIVAYRETEDNRYLITLAGLCRFRLSGEAASDAPYRLGLCDYAGFAGDLAESADEPDFPRQRLVSALKHYLGSRDMKADWKSVMNAPPETLVNALSMICPFEPAEKQALLEAPSFDERVSTLVAILEMAGAGNGPQTLN